MLDLQVWVRVGDADGYHAFDSPELAAEHVHEYLHTPDDEDEEPCSQGYLHGADGICDHEVERYTGRGLVGVEVGVFTGHNGVSLYWGTPDVQFYAALSDLELDAFTNSLQ